MKVQVSSLGKPSNFKVYKASRVWEDKDKFHSPVFGYIRRGLWAILLFKNGR